MSIWSGLWVPWTDSVVKAQCSLCSSLRFSKIGLFNFSAFRRQGMQRASFVWVGLSCFVNLSIRWCENKMHDLSNLYRNFLKDIISFLTIVPWRLRKMEIQIGFGSRKWTFLQILQLKYTSVWNIYKEWVTWWRVFNLFK